MLQRFTLVSLLLTLTIFFIQSPQMCAQVCPVGCTDIKPPRQPHSCEDIKKVFEACGTRTTGGDRYCKCTCGKCDTQVDPSWSNIDVSIIESPSPSPSPSPLPAPSIPTSQPLIIGGDTTSSQASIPNELGLAVGGSRGIDTFRRNIDNNVMPEVSDITYEGILNDYFFDISGGLDCDELLCIKYSGAISADPLSPTSQKEFYLAVGLQSGKKLQDFKRKNLNLVIVLDVSGSMRSPFEFFQGGSEIDKKLSKIDVAKQSILKLLDKLTTQDKFGVVTFGNKAKTVVQLKFATIKAKADAIEEINRISARGVTNLQAGLQQAAIMLQQEVGRQNRLIIITDANANRGEYSPIGLGSIIANYATQPQPIYSTIIGVGQDFNTELTDKILQTRGANYFSVYSPAELRNQLDQEFELFVTPLVYDLQLEIEKFSLQGKNGWLIVKVIGVPSAKETFTADDTVIFNVNTLFPSISYSVGAKGGIILIQLQPKSTTPNTLYMSISYKDPNFIQYQGQSQIGLFLNFNQEFFSSIAIQKAILLKRYVDLMKKWILETNYKGELKVSKDFGNDFVTFLVYINSQNKDIQDNDLDRETSILRKLIGVSAGN